MSESFTNRRGHQTSASDDRPVENLVEAPLNENIPKEVKLVPVRPRRRRSRLKLPWKWIGLVVGILLLAALVTFEIARFSYTSSVNSVQRQLETLVSTDVATAQQQKTLDSATINGLSDKTQAMSMSLCPGGFLDNFAQLYPRARQALNDCTLYREKVEALTAALTDMAEQAKYLSQLDSLLSPVAEPLPDQFAVLSSQQENWTSVRDGLRGTTPPEAFQAAHRTFVDRVSAITSIWVELASASNIEDSGRFTTASTKLKDLYAGVRASADEFETELSATQTRLSTTYLALQ